MTFLDRLQGLGGRGRTIDVVHVEEVDVSLLMFPCPSVDEWHPESDSWAQDQDQRIPTAMYSFPAIPVKIDDFCAN